VDLTARSLGLDDARARDASRYTIAGTVPRLALRPVTEAEVAEALRAATRDGLRVVPWGGGVSLPGQAAPPRYDVALDVTAFDAIVTHEPEDFTITAGCGITVAALRARLAAMAQELPLEGAAAARATLGGVLAANASGPRRLRFGSPRDRILGARFALADGTVARTGGRVVKNVAGHAVHRLLCGAHGALAVLLEASLKLGPAPAVRAALVWDVDAAALAEPARWSPLPRLEPAFMTVLGREAAARVPALGASSRAVVVLGFEDDAPWVARQCALVRDALGAERARLDGADVVALAQALADLEESPGPRMTFTTPSNTPAALAALADGPEAGGAVFHAPAGRLHLFPAGPMAPERITALAEAGLTSIGARGLGEVAPALPPQGALAPLRARIRAALDPAGTLANGDAWVAG
jgi:glycolate oxidase FAD binding subunit